MPERLRVLAAALACALLTACQSERAVHPPAAGPSAGAASADGCAAVTDEQLSSWVGAPQEVVDAGVAPATCHGMHLELDDPITVGWRLRERSRGAPPGLDRTGLPWFVVLRAAGGDQVIEVTVRNDSATEEVPAARLTAIARKVAASYG